MNTEQVKTSMTMAEAKARLMEIANGEYHSVEYSVNDHGNGNVNQVCKVYTSTLGSFSAAHWDSAIAAIEIASAGRPTITEDIPLSQPILNDL